jgi:F-type H+-transporting ATPase subunit delta
MTTSPRVLAKPYSRAIFNLSLKNQNVLQWRQLLQAAATSVQYPLLQAALRKPGRYLQSQKDRTGSRYSTAVSQLIQVCEPVSFEIGHRFLLLLAERKRLIILPAIQTIFEDYYAAHQKILKITVTSAMPLTAENVQQYSEQLTQAFQRPVVLETKIETALLGGLRLQVKDHVLDRSLRGRLIYLEKILKKAI